MPVARNFQKCLENQVLIIKDWLRRKVLAKALALLDSDVPYYNALLAACVKD